MVLFYLQAKSSYLVLTHEIGLVYRATWRGSLCAVKQLKLTKAQAHSKALDEFKKEANIMKYETVCCFIQLQLMFLM